MTPALGALDGPRPQPLPELAAAPKPAAPDPVPSPNTRPSDTVSTGPAPVPTFGGGRADPVLQRRLTEARAKISAGSPDPKAQLFALDRMFLLPQWSRLTQSERFAAVDLMAALPRFSGDRTRLSHGHGQPGSCPADALCGLLASGRLTERAT